MWMFIHLFINMSDILIKMSLSSYKVCTKGLHIYVNFFCRNMDISLIKRVQLIANFELIW